MLVCRNCNKETKAIYDVKITCSECGFSGGSEKSRLSGGCGAGVGSGRPLQGRDEDAETGREGLKPCPFCGGEAELFEREEGSDFWDIRCKTSECFMEDGSNWFLHPDVVTKMWNTRVGGLKQ